MRIFVMLGAISCGLSVACGAFASHALKAQISPRSLEILEIGARYQMYHGLALLGVGILAYQISERSVFLSLAGWSFIIGIMIFSGSLYALSLSGIGWLGAITPVGGVAFLIGWGCVAAATLFAG